MRSMRSQRPPKDVPSARNVEIFVLLSQHDRFRQAAPRLFPETELSHPLETVTSSTCIVVYRCRLREGADKDAFIQALEQAEEQGFIRTYQWYRSHPQKAQADLLGIEQQALQMALALLDEQAPSLEELRVELPVFWLHTPPGRWGNTLVIPAIVRSWSPKRISIDAQRNDGTWRRVAVRREHLRHRRGAIV
jgi:hypothetical protein